MTQGETNDRIKVIELIINQPDPDEGLDKAWDMTLTEDEIASQGLSVNSAFYILKKLHKEGWIKITHPICNEFDPDFPEYYHAIFLQVCVTEKSLEAYLDDLKYGSPDVEKISFVFENGKLIINNKIIKISERNEKTIAEHIVEYILKDKNDQPSYREIAEDVFEEDETTFNWRKYYYACKNLQYKITRITGVTDFLVFSSGEKGSVRINSLYS
jgi:hypothetical protein